jgi:hypothetical protein
VSYCVVLIREDDGVDVLTIVPQISGGEENDEDIRTDTTTENNRVVSCAHCIYIVTDCIALQTTRTNSNASRFKE